MVKAIWKNPNRIKMEKDYAKKKPHLTTKRKPKKKKKKTKRKNA